MLSERRQKLIEDYLNEVEFASLEELSEKLDVSISTIRRDLTRIEAGGRIRRTHGGARLVEQKKEEFSFSSRQQVESDSKDAVGAVCADLIGPGQNLFMDGGSTVFAVARYLERKSPHIVTNCLAIASLYAGNPEIEVIVTGGVVYPRLQVLVGDLAVHAYRSLSADIAIMGGGGANENGIMNSHLLLIEIQRAMIASAQRVIFCLDHTKIGRRSFTSLCKWDAVDILVTDRGAPKELLQKIEAQGVEIILA